MDEAEGDQTFLLVKLLGMGVPSHCIGQPAARQMVNSSFRPWSC